MDQKNDILHTLRRREDEFHLPLREGGWERLAEELAPRPAALRRATPWRWLAVAAAALLCVALSIPLFLPQKTVEVVSDSRTASPIDLPVAPQYTATPSVSIVSQSPVMADVVEATPLVEMDSVSVAPVAESAPIKEEAPTPPSHKQIGPEPEKKASSSHEALIREKSSTVKRADAWSFGVQAGSGRTTGALDTTPMDYNENETPSQPNDPDPGKPDPEKPDLDKPQVETQAMPRSALRSTAQLQYRHRMPLSVGLSVRKSFTDKFALESGLSYTFLYSDISQQGLSVSTGNQQIHYIGIPLKANWTLYRAGAFSLYLTAGALAEYAISARCNLSSASHSLDMNRWQFSLNGALGAEFRLIHPVSLYLEPGIGYYFDAGDDVPTIRTERPWLLGVQLGLRFSY